MLLVTVVTEGPLEIENSQERDAETQTVITTGLKENLRKLEKGSVGSEDASSEALRQKSFALYGSRRI